jgi:predicted ATPase
MSGDRQIVFVAGEAGIGKTTLVDAFLAQLHDRPDIRISSGQCVEQYGPGEAYMPLLEAIGRLCRGPSRERRIADLKRYAPSLLVQLPGLLDPVESARLQEQVQGTSRERMLREMAQAAELFTARRGLVLVLEDLHWSDVSTLEWLSYVAQRREHAKLMILGTYRPGEMLAEGSRSRSIVQELSARSQCVEVSVAPLGEAVVQEYVARRCNGTVPPQAFVQSIHRRTEGNPLFIRTAVDYLLTHGVISESEGHWHFRADFDDLTTSVPETIRQLIEKQVERVPREEQQALEVASIVGVEFTVAEVASGLQGNIETIEVQCERLAQTGQFLRMEGVTEWPDGTLSGRYSFLHALYREVLAVRVGGTRRIHWHRRIAERKETAYGERVGEIAAELAVHFEEGRDLPRAVAYLERAGRNALQRSANAEATRHLTRALTLLSSLPATVERTRQELTLRLALGTPLLALKGYGSPEVRLHYQQARALCRELNDPPDLFPVLWGLWIAHTVAGELNAAEALGDQLSQFAEHMGDADLSLQAHHALWTTLVARGELTTCRLHIEQGLHLYRTDRHYAQTFMYGGHDPGACCRIFGGYLYWLLGYPDRALQLSQEALELGNNLSHGQTKAWALSGKAMVHQFRGEALAAQQTAEEAIALSTEHQYALWAAYSPPTLGWALAVQGKHQEGIAQAQAGLAALRATGTGVWQSQFLTLLVYAYSEAGELREGLRTIDEALAAAERSGEHFYEAELYRLRGELLLTQEVKNQKANSKRQKSENPKPKSQIPEPAAEAEEWFLKAIAIAQEQHAKSWELRAATSLARLWHQQNKADAARELLQEIYDWFTEGFDTKDLQEAEALLVSLGGRGKTEEERQKAKITDPRPLTPDFQSSAFSPQSLPAPDSGPWTLDLGQVLTSDLGPRTLDSPSQTLDSGQVLTLDAVFRHHGDYWTLAYEGQECRVRDMRGLHYLAYLLRHPNDDIHTVRLIAGDAASGDPALSGSWTAEAGPLSASASDSGELLDAHARAAYKQRLADLQAELDEAQTFHDQGRVDALREEWEFLTNELTQALGLGGRARRIGSSTERARVAVTRAIKNALNKIQAHHAPLGHYLTRTIKTGTFCVYAPDPRAPMSWQF